MLHRDLEAIELLPGQIEMSPDRAAARGLIAVHFALTLNVLDLLE
jgi:hypothetical protein